jgi:zona occludens toxin
MGVVAMIEMLEGVPGSGKSYYAVSERLLKWVRAGRRVYVFVDGFYLDRLAMFEGSDQADLEKQITVWVTADDVRRGMLQVDPGSAVLIDEVQTVFRSKEKTDPELLRWLETHRHRGIDLVLMCQQYGQVTLGVNRLVEVTTKFRRLDRFGLKNRYQAAVRGNPEEVEVVRMFTGKYQPKVYAYYSSYSHAGVRETARGGSIMKSPTMIIGIVGLLAAGWWFSFGGWLTGAKRSQTADVTTRDLVPVQLSPDVQGADRTVSSGAEIRPITIQGGLTMERNGKEVWLWVASDGRFLIEDEIAAESGGSVTSKMVRGVRVLKGSGVVYGGNVPDGVHVAALPPMTFANVPSPAAPIATTPVFPAVPMPPPAVPMPSPSVAGQSGSIDLLATPPSLLATPPGLF